MCICYIMLYIYIYIHILYIYIIYIYIYIYIYPIYIYVCVCVCAFCVCVHTNTEKCYKFTKIYYDVNITTDNHLAYYVIYWCSLKDLDVFCFVFTENDCN